MTNEERYRELVVEAIDRQKYFLSLMPKCDKGVRRLIWLRLMGLMETWDMI